MEYKILTLNCWGIALVSKDRKNRMHAIAELLATSHYDVVCLQELWVDADYQLIKDKVSGVLPYSHYFYSGVTGSGVCVLSKEPIEEVFFHQWPVNGYIHKVQHGDWFGGKGVGLCKLKINDFKINIYSAHLHAEYNRTCDEYQAHRILQAFDTAQFIQLTSGDVDLVVLAGDLNTEPGDLAYRILLSIVGFTDAYTESGVTEVGTTSECPTNSYTSSAQLKRNFPGQRIDYIMYCAGAELQVDLKTYELPLPDRVPGCTFSYSDHEAVTVTLHLKLKRVDRSPKSCDDYDLIKKTVLEESIAVCSDAIKNLAQHKFVYWLYTVVLLILLSATLVTNSPFGLPVLYHVLKVLITICMAYTFIMATLWNQIERNAINAGILSMEISLSKLKCPKETQ